MDTLTHVLSGALTGRCLSSKVRKASPKAFILVGALAALFPDLDIVMRFISDSFYLLNHRGFSHSFILLPIFAILIASFVTFLLKNKIIFKNGWIQEDATFKELLKEFYPLALLGLFIHVCGDIITSFGTMFLYPFSNNRYESGSVFIIDLIFTGIIVLGLIFSAKEKNPAKKILVGRIFMIGLISYVSFTQYLKYDVIREVKKNIQISSVNINDLHWKSVPQMLSPFDWLIMGFDEKTKDYHLVRINYFDDKSKWKIENYNTYGHTNPERAKKVMEDKFYADYVWFLTDPVYHSENNECVFFQKAQNISNFRNPFVYGFCEKDGNKFVIKKR